MMKNKVPYPKQIQTFAKQISILKQRGLMISDEQESEKWLHKVSYYRMSGYCYPLLADRQNHIFKPGSTFEQARMLYEFDSHLRHIVFSAIERIGIAIRTQMAYCHVAGFTPWFTSAIYSPIVPAFRTGPWVYCLVSLATLSFLSLLRVHNAPISFSPSFAIG